MTSARSLAVVLFALCTGCPGPLPEPGAEDGGSGDGSVKALPPFDLAAPNLASEPSAIPLEAQVVDGLLLAPAAVDGVSGAPLVVSTGSPWTELDTSQFKGAATPDYRSPGTVRRLHVAGLALAQPPLIGSPGATLGSVQTGGALGGNLLRQFHLRLNYRDREVSLVDRPAPSNLQAPVATTPFELRGGGTLRYATFAGWRELSYPSSRVLLSAVIDGKPCTLLLNSGSPTALSTAFFSQLVGDGRRVLSFAADTRLTRLKSVTVAGVEAKGIIATDSTKLQAVLEDLEKETGVKVDGMLGSTFLREFLVDVDYPRGELTLRRYQSNAHIQDELTRLGAFLQASANGEYVISRVLPGTDAEKQGLKVGERVYSINAVKPSPGGLSALVLGKVGDVRSVQLQTRVVDVKVEDLLSL